MMRTAIRAGRVFDGAADLGPRTIVIEGDEIVGVDGPVPPDAEVVDAPDATLLPGLIDAHVHLNGAGLGVALTFGVTTALEMQGAHTANDRLEITEDDRVADVRSAGFALTAPGGHPDELFPEDFRPRAGGDGGKPGGGEPGGPPHGRGRPRVDPIVDARVTTPQEAVVAVGRLAEAGSDYIKFMVDDGSVEGHPGIPMLDQATLDAGVEEAHRRGLLTVAHALTLDATQMCLDAGIDGLAHLFIEPHTPRIVERVASSGTFVIACIVLDASMIGITGEALADDPRVRSTLPDEWDETLRSSFHHYPQGRLSDVLASARALHEAGADILVGTDVSAPFPFLGGVAPGASVHQELQYLVQAGFSPAQALAAATSVPARRFGLDDRGTIAVGQRADLVLVDGDPLENIHDTLNVRAVWRRGARLT